MFLIILFFSSILAAFEMHVSGSKMKITIIYQITKITAKCTKQQYYFFHNDNDDEENTSPVMARERSLLI